MDTHNTKHIGQNICRIRELRGVKQDALAYAMGISQQTVSNIENSAAVDDEKLKSIAKELGVNKEAIQNFSEEALIEYFNSASDTPNDITIINQAYLDRVIYAYEFSLKLYAEKEALYERLLQSEREKFHSLSNR